MIARRAERDDRVVLEGLLTTEDLSPDRDVLIVSGRPAQGALVWRPTALVHELIAGHDLLRLNRADSMLNFAIAEGQALRWPIRDVLFVVDEGNESMHRYARHIGATQYPGVLYTLKLP